MEGSAAAAAAAAAAHVIHIILNPKKRFSLSVNFIGAMQRIGTEYGANIIKMSAEEYLDHAVYMKGVMEDAVYGLCYGIGDDEYKMSLFDTASFLIVVTDASSSVPIGLTTVIVRDHKLPKRRELYISVICSARPRIGTLQMNMIKDIARLNNYGWIRLESMKEATKFYTEKSGFVGQKGENTAKNLCKLEFNVRGHTLLCKLDAAASPKRNTLKRRRNNNNTNSSAHINSRTLKKVVSEKPMGEK
jgi:hypothetical protein